MPDPIQSLCETGQRALIATDYLAAARSLAAAEALAWDAADYDALARLYMPLQEARRQCRQTCGDGAFATIVAASPDERLDAHALAARFARGHLLVAGHATIVPALTLRTIADQRGLYLDLPLAAAYSVAGTAIILIVPTPDAAPPPAKEYESIDALLAAAPPHCVATPRDAVPPDRPRGDAHTFAHGMAVWEALHAPFLAVADAETGPHEKLEKYRRTIRVDYACEFAHQRLSDTARTLVRRK